jgi:hypothetical protein
MRRIGRRSTALADHLAGQVEGGHFFGIAMHAVAFDDLMLHDLDGLGRRQVNHLPGAGHTAAGEGAATVGTRSTGMQLNARRFLACAPAIMLRVAFAPLLRLTLRHRPFHLGLAFLLGLLGLRQLLGELGKLLFQGSIFRLQRGSRCLQLVNALDGFFKGWWHGVSIPHVYPPRCEQLQLESLRLKTPVFCGACCCDLLPSLRATPC